MVGGQGGASWGGARVLQVAGALGLLSLLPLGPYNVDWFVLKPNRLVAGESYSLFAAAGVPAVLLLAVLLALLLAGTFSRLRTLAAPAAAAATFLLLYAVGSSATQLSTGQPPSARVTLAAGFWLAALASYVGWFGALSPSNQAGTRRGLRSLPAVLLGATFVAAIYLVASGHFAELGLAKELVAQGADFRAELGRHVAISLTSLTFGAAIAIPSAIWAHRSPPVASWLLPTVAFFQTLPSLALFGVLLPLLARLGQQVTLGQALLLGILLLPLALLPRLSSRWVRAGLVILAAVPAVLYFTILSTVVAGVVGNLLGGGGPGSLGALAWNLHAPLAELGVRGIGAAPALIALTLYSLLPMARNSYEGLAGVPEETVQAARGMGMSEAQLMRGVKLPLALPLMIEGVRAAAVLTIGITTVAFLIGAGGLGVFIQRGIDQVVPDLVLLGALPVIALALAADGLLRAAGNLLMAPPLKGGEHGAA